MFLLWSAWTVVAGVGIPLVGVLNGGLARSIGNPISAAAVMFAVAFACVALLAVSFYGLPNIAQLKSAPLSGYGAGLFIAFYAVSATIIIPRFGAGNFVAFILLAQLLMSAMLDQFGLLGLPVRPITVVKAAAFLLIAIGIVVMQLATTNTPE